MQPGRNGFSARLNRLIYSRKVLLLLAVAGTLMTALVAGWIYRLEARAADNDYYEKVVERSRFLARELDAGVEALYTLAEVIRFVDSLPDLVYQDVAGATLHRNPGLLALEWLPRVKIEDVGSFQARMGRYIPGYTVVDLDVDGNTIPLASEGDLFPVAFVAPLETNRPVIGVNFFSERDRRSTLERAWLAGDLAVSPPLRLIQLEDNERGMLMVLPVFQGRPDTASQRRAALRGFVIAAIDMRVLVATVLAGQDGASDYMRIDDISEPENLRVLFESGAQGEQLQQSVVLPPLGGRLLRVSMAPSAGRSGLQVVYLPAVVGIAGGLMVLLVCGYLYVLQRQGEIIGEQVQLQTHALREANFRLETLSVTDPLTGLANRRAFDDYVDPEWQRAARQGEPLTILLVDVDHFKRINDGYGHPAGDACLRELARRLRAHFKRPADRVVRFGGEEFAVVLPNTSAEGGFTQADRFRAFMASEPVAISPDHSLSVTISGGVATVVPDAALTPRDLIKRADEALYLAKRSGRNRIETYRPEATQSAS